jgi:hypothetical protein
MIEAAAIILVKLLKVLAITVIVIPLLALFCGPELFVIVLNHIWTRKTKKYTIITVKILLLPITFMYYLVKEGQNVRKQQIEDHYKQFHHVKSNRTKTTEDSLPVRGRHHLAFGNPERPEIKQS